PPPGRASGLHRLREGDASVVVTGIHAATVRIPPSTRQEPQVTFELGPSKPRNFPVLSAFTHARRILILLCRAFEEVSVSRGLGLFSAAMLICASSAPALAGEGGAVTGGVAGAVGGAMVGGPVGAVVGGLGGAAIGNAATGHRYYHHHGYAYHPYHHYYYHDR